MDSLEGLLALHIGKKIFKNSILFTADKEVHCPGNVFSLAPLGPVAVVGCPREGLSTAPIKEKGFKQLLRYSKNEDIRKELLQKKIYWNVLEVKIISTL